LKVLIPLHESGKRICLFPLFISVIAGFIASCPGKKDSTSTLLQQNRFYCFMPGEKKLDFHAFAANSVLLRHALRKKTRLQPFYDKFGLITTLIEKKDSTSTLLRQNRSYCDMN